MTRWLVAAMVPACWTAAAPPPPPVVPAAKPDADLALVARCATEAVELLGWNPVPDGAHHGAVIRTALEHGGSADCAPLADDANASTFHVGDREIDWDWEPKDRPDATTITFAFTCAGCKRIETRVALPRRWHCFSWMEMAHNGTVCEPDAAACDASRARFGANTTPCALHTGAAWCQRGTQTCADSPWSCANSPTRAPCDRVP